jgi:hypothetical protein
MSGPNLAHDDKPVRRSEIATAMVDWTILSPTFLAAVIEWAGAVATVLAVGPGSRSKNIHGSEDDDVAIGKAI